MFDVPILLIVFNRPQTTEKIFERIRQLKPQKLFVAADAPRPHKDQDEFLCQKVRQLATNVDWDCEVKTLFQPQNLGCGKAPAQAISWFFSHVEEGIILEDDCLADITFFRYCAEMLEKFRHDPRIFMVSGTNYVQNWHQDTQSYHFSFYGSCWAWATWRRAWQFFDYQIPLWANPQTAHLIAHQVAHQAYFELYLRPVYQKTFQNPDAVSWWDYQWSFVRYLQSGLAVVPSQNLVKNIGFEADATHTNAASPDPFVNLPTYSLGFPLQHNPCIVADRLYEQEIYKVLCPPVLPIWKRAIRKIKRILTNYK